MSVRTNRTHAVADRPNLYDEITGKIIAELEAGRFPWVQPWGTSAIKASLSLPRNASTHRTYSGINVLILWGAVVEHGFPTQKLDNLSTGVRARRERPQRRARNNGRLCEARSRDGRGCSSHTVPQTLHRFQHRAMWRATWRSRSFGPAVCGKSDRTAGRGADQRPPVSTSVLAATGRYMCLPTIISRCLRPKLSLSRSIGMGQPCTSSDMPLVTVHAWIANPPVRPPLENVRSRNRTKPALSKTTSTIRSALVRMQSAVVRNKVRFCKV